MFHFPRRSGHEVDGVRKEKERLTADDGYNLSDLFSFHNLELLWADGSYVEISPQVRPSSRIKNRL